MTNHPNRNAKNYAAAERALVERLCAKYPALASRAKAGLLVVARDRGAYYVHHDNGVGRTDYADVVAALDADDIVLTVGGQVRAA